MQFVTDLRLKEVSQLANTKVKSDFEIREKKRYTAICEGRNSRTSIICKKSIWLDQYTNHKQKKVTNINPYSRSKQVQATREELTLASSLS